jgi:hypothetical protein
MSLHIVTAVFCLAVLAVGATGCGGKEVLRNADDAARYIDDVVHGGSAARYKLADDASRAAQVAVDDAGPLKQLQDTIDATPDAACEVVGIVSQVGDVTPGSYDDTLDVAEAIQVQQQADPLGIPSTVRSPVVTAALEMAQSTWIEAADAACNL